MTTFVVPSLKKKFEYVAPASPPNLSECSSFTINFPSRKFLHVGLDPTQDIVILIITPSRHILITVDLLQRIFRLIGNILSFLLNAPTYKKNIFLSTKAEILSSMVYKGENTLVIESKSHEGCRVLLNREDLMELLNLENLILRNISRLEKSKKKNDSVSLQPSFSPPSFPSLSPPQPPSYTSFVNEERGDDHNDGAFGPQYLNSMDEEEYNLSNYVIQL